MVKQNKPLLPSTQGQKSTQAMIQRQQFLDYMDDLLEVQNFHDFCPQGLQVSGSEKIYSITLAVTASLAAIQYAAQEKSDLLLAHHGLFWQGESPVITGWKKARIATLLAHNINLAVYHLPLDAHPILGNSAQLAKRLNWVVEQRIADRKLLFIGHLKQPRYLAELAEHISNELNRTPLVIGQTKKLIRRIAWCTGAGQSFFLNAIEEGVDAFLTGEASEAQFHLAYECDTAFIAAGHYATERYGIQALGKQIEQDWGIKVHYFENNNPI